MSFKLPHSGQTRTFDWLASTRVTSSSLVSSDNISPFTLSHRKRRGLFQQKRKVQGLWVWSTRKELILGRRRRRQNPPVSTYCQRLLFAIEARSPFQVSVWGFGFLIDEEFCRAFSTWRIHSSTIEELQVSRLKYKRSFHIQHPWWKFKFINERPSMFLQFIAAHEPLAIRIKCLTGFLTTHPTIDKRNCWENSFWKTQYFPCLFWMMIEACRGL